jgi:pantoate--beta-alanine ligase
MKLLNIVNPTNGYFGKKDGQQLILITLMVKQLFMSVNVVAMDTIRESDGLALSSRNVYLNEYDRKEALKISASLRVATKMVSSGILNTEEIIQNMREALYPLEIAYVTILNRDFENIESVEIGNTVILVEAIAGETRLLDNLWI